MIYVGFCVVSIKVYRLLWLVWMMVMVLFGNRMLFWRVLMLVVFFVV